MKLIRANLDNTTDGAFWESVDGLSQEDGAQEIIETLDDLHHGVYIELDDEETEELIAYAEKLQGYEASSLRISEVEPSEYIVLGEESISVKTAEAISEAEGAMRAAEVWEAEVWTSPHSVEWAQSNGDPDGRKNGQRLILMTRHDAERIVRECAEQDADCGVDAWLRDAGTSGDLATCDAIRLLGDDAERIYDEEASS